MSYLVDTNVISELRRGPRADPSLAAWFEQVSPDEIYLSVLTIGEIRKGIEKIRHRDETAAYLLETWLHVLVISQQDRILKVDQEIAQHWGRLHRGDPLPVIDSLLAATAATYHLTLVTRNVRDFARTGIVCLNPFSKKT